MYIVIAIFIATAAVWLIRAHGYRYCVSSNYEYDFCVTEMSRIDVERRGSSFQCLNVGDNVSSIFWKVSVKSGLLGHVVEPFLVVHCGGRESKCYFEIGVDGVRYVNLSRFVESCRDNCLCFSISCVGLTLCGWCEAFVGTPKVDIDEKLLVISPHPDDAEISAFGLYSSMNSFIVTVTDGARSEKLKGNYGEVESLLRCWDSKVVPSLGGVSFDRAINLRYDDLSGIYQKKLAEECTADRIAANKYPESFLDGCGESRAFQTWGMLVDDLAEVINEFKPDIIVIPHPGIDGHRDHQLVARALVDAIFKINYMQCRLFMYVIHLFFADSYPCGRKNSAVSLPPSFNNDVYFESVYSYELNGAQMYMKYHALGAMHALRPSPWCWDGVCLIFFVVKKIVKAVLNIENSHCRRNVRENELFFVVDPKSLSRECVANKLFSSRLDTCYRSIRKKGGVKSRLERLLKRWWGL